MENEKSGFGISGISKSPLREHIDRELKAKAHVLARFYIDAIQHGMNIRDAREAFNAAMNADADRYLSDIMTDIPSYVIATLDVTRTIDYEKEQKAQAIIDRLLYSPIGEWERLKKIANSEVGHTGALL